MKFLSGKSFTLVLASMAIFSSCKEDKADNITINTGKNGGAAKLTYTIQVLDAVGNTGGRVGVVSGATITYNVNGRSVSKTTDNSGVAVITDAKPGTFIGRLSLAEYASVEFVADLSPSAGTAVDSGAEYYAATRLYVPRSNAALTARVFGNYTYTTGNVNPTFPNYQRTVRYKVLYSINKLGNKAYPMGSGPGRLIDVSLEPSTIRAESDQTGSIIQEGLHATQSGLFEAYLSIVPLTVAGIGTRSDSTFVIGATSGAMMNSIKLDLSSADTLKLGNVQARPMR